MFGWLAKMLLKTPVASSGCACCEAKREHLEKMRKKLTGEDDAESISPKIPESFSSGSLHIYCAADGSGKEEILVRKEECSCGKEHCCGDGSCGCGHCQH